MIMKTSALRASCAVLAIIPATGVWAQTPVEQNQSTVGDIIVTAQKREQAINDVGLTIQAATSATLANRGIGGVTDLGKIVPGFTYTESLYATPVYTLRGVGLYDSNWGGSPSVAVYTDQVSRNVSVMSSALDLDLERVEVLKGPQGTLFGQSSTGGAINYITAKPTDHFTAGLDVSYERFGKFIGSGFVSGAITDNLRVRLAVGATQGGAWQYSITRPDDRNGDTRRIQGRLSLDWTPTDRLTVAASATATRDRSDPTGSQYTGSLLNIYSAQALAAANANPATANPYGYVDEAKYAAFTTPGSPAYNPGFVAAQTTVVQRMNGVLTIPGIPDLAAGSHAILATPIATNPREADWTPGLFHRNNDSYYQGIVRADYALSDEIKATSITALARQRLDYYHDIDATTAKDADSHQYGTVNSFNQELRLAGDTKRIKWIIGANYDNVRATQIYIPDFSHWSANSPLGLPLTTNVFTYFRSTQHTYAGYGNIEFNLTDNLSFQAGARYTQNNMSGTFCLSNPAGTASQSVSLTFAGLSDIFRGLPAGTTQIAPGQCLSLGNGKNGTILNAPQLEPLTLTLKENNTSFRIGASYKFDRGTLVYATISQGYKAGLFSNIGATSVDQYIPAKQEKIIAYEAGFKMPLFDRRVRFNGAGF